MRTTITFTPRNFKKMVKRGLRAERVHDHGYRVPSTSEEGREYFVSVRFTADGVLDPRCSCPAGNLGRGCCHALAVVHELQRDTRHLAALLPKEDRRAA